MFGTKDTNPKDIIGMKKVPMSTLSCPVLFEMALGMLEGARKYGRHNYRALGVSATIYYDAAIGHLMDWWEGEDLDPDSGLSHVTKAMTALAVLRDSMLMGNWIDDRPIRNPNKLYKKSFNPKAKEIIEKYPYSIPPFLAKEIKEFVVPEEWKINYISKDTGWCVSKLDGIHNNLLWKDLTIHQDSTGWLAFYQENKRRTKIGEAPGYWPTEADAKAALQQYLEKNDG